MYLSRIELDSGKRETLVALAAPNKFHGAVEAATGSKEERKLWRIDVLRGKRYLMLLSETPPDLTVLAQQFGEASDEDSWASKDYTPLLERIAEGDTWHFRLVANPTHSIAKKNGGRGKVVAHQTPEHQKAWLVKKSEQLGFSLRDDDFQVVEKQWHIFNKGSEGRQVRLLSVAFEGDLRVTDPQLFRTALTKGIGRGKAYGMGMMTIVNQRRG